MRSACWQVVLVLLVASATIAAMGCAKDPKTVSRVSSDAIAKSDLAGEWYYLQTVVDVPAGTPYTFAGDQSKLSKIVWRVDEDELIAQRSYEVTAHLPEGADDPDSSNRVIVAMFRIVSHFDPGPVQTIDGETTNGEDTDGRPWFAREFIRVDWTKNLVEDGQFMTINRALHGLTVESSRRGELAPFGTVLAQDGKEHVNYIDVVNRMIVKPASVEIADFGDLPTCLVTSNNPQLCGDAEISVRNSFRKAEDHDYQPVIYTNDRAKRFGFFVAERSEASQDYGVIETVNYRFAQRHNIWQKSHRSDEAGKPILCTEDAQCSNGRGSVCDQDYGRAHGSYDPQSHDPVGRCTIAFRDREVRPIVYYMSANHPAELAADADSIAASWNRAFVDTVSSLRENECAAQKGKQCAEERDRKDHQKIFYVCTTPVAADAPEVCGQEGLSPGRGDLRYNQIAWVDEDEGGPLGYAPGQSDPETGETIMGNVIVNGSAIARFASYGRSVVRLLKSDVTRADAHLEGSYIAGWAKAARERVSANAGSNGAIDHTIEMTPEILAGDVAAMDFAWAQSGVLQAAPGTIVEAQAAFKLAREALEQNGAFGKGNALGNARVKRLLDTDIEELMLAPELRLGAGLYPSDGLDKSALDAASPLRGMSLDSLRAIERARQIILEQAGYYDADFQEEGIIGLALEIYALAGKAKGAIEWYGKKYMLTEEGALKDKVAGQMIVEAMYHGLTLHGLGHSLGLRHNFSGSYDAVNYGTEYWELRDDGNLMPRLWDKVSPQEMAGRIHEHQYSSVMDYSNNFLVSHENGLGHYDIAAIKLGYGDLVEVFSSVPSTNKTKISELANMQGRGWPVSFDFQAAAGPSAYAYTDWPSLVGGRNNLEARSDVPYTQLGSPPSLIAQGIDDKLVDGEGRPAVPYMFCSDEQVDLTPECMRYDAGADPFESVQSIVDAYSYYYPFVDLRLPRFSADFGNTVRPIHGRYFEKIKRAHQRYALYRAIFRDSFNLQADDAFWQSPSGMGAWSAATAMGFKLLKQVVTTPAPGAYSQITREDGVPLLVSDDAVADVNDAVSSVSELDGRVLNLSWDNATVAYFGDKAYAIMTLADPKTYLIRTDNDNDIGRYELSYAATFGPSVHALFRSLLSEDWLAAAPRLVDGKVTYPELAELATRTMDGTPLLPNVSFPVQLYAAVFGIAYLPQTAGQDFLNSARVWVGDELNVDPSKTLVSFTNPYDELTYHAVSHPEGPLERGVGASLLNYANALSKAAAGPDLTFGTTDDDAAALKAMATFVDTIEVVRELTKVLGSDSVPSP